MHDDQIKENFKQDEQRSGAADSNMSYDEQNDNPMEPGEKEPKKRQIQCLILMKTRIRKKAI
ncbi:hypothetical protein [Loigolactobacillus coryniformis]|uniref:hypothetical protein n=1 Tax=Loigolactobacillus coryniformis TaxID=1610 RepID=UPI000219651D|nr:hypothetical protein [Loigolactobacillus coryniformis]